MASCSGVPGRRGDSDTDGRALLLLLLLLLVGRPRTAAARALASSEAEAMVARRRATFWYWRAWCPLVTGLHSLISKRWFSGLLIGPVVCARKPGA